MKETKDNTSKIDCDRLVEPKNRQKRKYFSIAVCAGIFLIAYMLGADFGKFQPDYYFAHSITMSHLHRDGDFLQLLRTIPNSASGVFPLWLFGFFKGFQLHKIMSLCVFIGIVTIIWRATRLNMYGYYYLMALLLSPMMISATAWVLPEVFTLLTVVLVFMLTINHPNIAVLLSPLVPISRQTFIVHLAGRLFFRPKNTVVFIAMCVMATLALASLVYVWGGLVPPKLRGVHLTPSIKSPINALLIFSLYFTYHNVSLLNKMPINLKKLAISVGVGSILVWMGLHQPPLLGGGYIFSRIEAKSIILSGLIETLLLTLFFYKTKINTIVFIILASMSFITTNYMFLKYVDFYFFAFLAFGISDINERFHIIFTEYARSGFMFEMFSLLVAGMYYMHY